MNLGAPSWVLGLRTKIRIDFIGFQFYFGISITLAKILDGIEDGHHTSLDMCIMAGHVTGIFGIPEVIFQARS